MNIVNLLKEAWQDLPDDARSRIIQEVSPNKVVASFISSLANAHQDLDLTDPQEDPDAESDEDDVIDVEFSEGLDDGFGV